MEIQNFLRSSRSDPIPILKKDYGIKVSEQGDVVVFNYHQIQSIKTHPITIECRSLKLKAGTWEIMSRSFDRFFNYGEAPELMQNFSFETTVVMEKVDGSLIPVWFDGTSWHISTRGRAYGDGTMTSGITYSQNIQTKFPEFISRMQLANPEYTYMFEYIGPDNRIVTPYNTSELVLLGIRHNSTGHYLKLKEMESFISLLDLENIRMVKMYKMNDMQQVVALAKSLNNLDEGYVCWDLASDIRTKIKSPHYVAIHHMGGQLDDTKTLIGICLSGETSEILVYYPEVKDKLVQIEIDIQKFKSRFLEEWTKVKDIEIQKDFALALKSSPYRKLFFDARRYGKEPWTIFLDLPVKLQSDMVLL